ncbi:thymidylate synthase [Mesorhizobium sp. VK4C]|uniref:thymidylate synthase n=1 Tax=Mesorhizobium captivum TaxID=3072319 RepID=UPI002A24809D|nr:thymidylate synthase [Mesorhizobium sp. VK4C]MDX8501907.1 thymidylate synthase [Mesorhizobium sp. VK4C]
MPSNRNISFALVRSVQELLLDGADVVVKGRQTKELIAKRTQLERPLERYLFTPKRHNHIAAQFAESMWVLAGRNDIAWLTKYLPRAPLFSDDGETWRGAYGPRLRRWGGVDQIDAVRRLLLADRTSRQGVMALFDPAQDYEPSKDIPCNNWLGWIIRDNRLQMCAALRSNDVWWGFSGVNAFEWSILHEMLAYWVNAEVGHADYLAMSFHLYSDHFDRGGQMVTGFQGLSPYDFGVERAAFATRWEEFQPRLDRWFALEAEISARPDAQLGSFGRVGDALLDSGLTLAHVAQAHTLWGKDRLADELAQLPACDYVAALYEEWARTYPGLLETVRQPAIADFLAARSRSSADMVGDFKVAVKKLHAEKDRAYGGAWKKRGELVSIQPNIARKVDRLDTLAATGAGLTDETGLDTAVDLLVYVEKYRLFLAEQLPPGTLVPADAPIPLSSSEQNFDTLLDRLELKPSCRPLKDIIRDVNAAFDACWHGAEDGETAEQKLKLATTLSGYSAELLAMLVHSNRQALTAFVQSGTSA